MIKWLLYLMFLLGILTAFALSIQRTINYVIRDIQNSTLVSSRVPSFIRKYKMLTQVLFGDKIENIFGTILFGYFMLCTATFVYFSRLLNVLYAFIFTGMLVVVPFVYLRMRLFAIRLESSHEGEFLITELLDQYKINHCNMTEAIDRTVVASKNAPRTRTMLFSISMRLKTYAVAEQLDDILEDFVFIAGTQWSKMLANNVRLAVLDGYDVTHGLEDIRDELRRARESYEKSERNTVEGFAIVKYLIPGLYLFTVYLSIKVFDFTISKFIEYQFLTPSGIKLFMVNGILYGFNLIVMFLFTRRKLDIM